MKMNFIQWILLQFYVFTLLIRSSDLVEPFIFNPYTLKIYNSSSNLPNESFKGPYATACPANEEKQTEKEINEGLTLDGKGLIVRDFHDLQTVEPELGCNKGFELAAAFKNNGNVDSFEFGYEIYFKYDTLPIDTRNAYYTKYVPVSYARSLGKQLVHDMFYRIVDHPNDEESVDIIWIKKFGIKYDVFFWNFVNTVYSIHRNVSRQLKIKCNNHDLGIQFYNKKHGPFDHFFSAENQKNIFSLVQLPEANACESTFECVKKYNLLMPYHFEPYLDSPVSCSNLTTIPIWHERIEELLNNLEKFLVAIGQVTENELRIIPGAMGVLSFPRKRKSFGSKSMPLYLYARKKRIPISKIIYKIVSYQTYNCNSKKELCWFNVAILIHNQPVFAKEEKLCHKDKCQEWGWEMIKHTNTSTKAGNGSEFIYCCEWNNELRKALGFKGRKYIQQNLNLFDFPVYDKEKKDHYYVNKKKEFEEKMKQLKKETEM